MIRFLRTSTDSVHEEQELELLGSLSFDQGKLGNDLQFLTKFTTQIHLRNSPLKELTPGIKHSVSSPAFREPLEQGCNKAIP